MNPITLNERAGLEADGIKLITVTGYNLPAPASGKVFALGKHLEPAVGIFGDPIGTCTYVKYLGYIDGVCVVQAKAKMCNPMTDYVFLVDYRRRRAFKKVVDTLNQYSD